MKPLNCQGRPPSSPSSRRKSRFHLRGRNKKNKGIQGRLRIRSVPGAFLVLGLVVVAVGTALAVAGYWPYRLSRSSSLDDTEEESLSEPQASWTVGTKGLLPPAGLLHGERMKLLGPIIMGVGLFILICANTVLYENRDRETQMLLAQMRSVICSVSAAVPSTDLRDAAAANLMTRQYQWVGSLPAAQLNILCLQQVAGSEPLLQAGFAGDQEDGVGGVHQSEALHHRESLPPPSRPSSSCQTECEEPTGPDQGGRTSFGSQASLPKLDLSLELDLSLVSSSSMSNLMTEDGDVPAAQPRHCHSMSQRTRPFAARRPGAARLEAGLHSVHKGSQRNQLKTPTGETSSQVCVKVPGNVAESTEDFARQSWPRLDLGSGRRYLKLDNKQDSVDKLLDQLEQQQSSCTESFGSGPFQ